MSEAFDGGAWKADIDRDYENRGKMKKTWQ